MEMGMMIKQDLHPCICDNPDCEKLFYVQDCRAYVYKGREGKYEGALKYFCSYTCWRKWQNKMDERPSVKQQKKKIARELAGESKPLTKAEEWDFCFTNECNNQKIMLKDVAKELGISYETLTSWRKWAWTADRGRKIMEAVNRLVERSKK